MSNEITAYFKGTSGVSESVYQFDYGMILIIDGPDLTAPFEVHFEHTGGVDAVTAIGQDNRVAIPNACLALPGRVTAYIYDHTGQHDGQTAYVVRFQVMNRARPVDEVTDEQDSAISKAIALLAEPIDNIETIVNEALALTGTTLSRLEAQFDAAVHAVTTDTEVTNIRVGDDGVTYNTAGQAVRAQFNNIKSGLGNVSNKQLRGEFLKVAHDIKDPYWLGNASNCKSYSVSGENYTKDSNGKNTYTATSLEIVSKGGEWNSVDFCILDNLAEGTDLTVSATRSGGADYQIVVNGYNGIGGDMKIANSHYISQAYGNSAVSYTIPKNCSFVIIIFVGSRGTTWAADSVATFSNISIEWQSTEEYNSKLISDLNNRSLREQFLKVVHDKKDPYWLGNASNCKSYSVTGEKIKRSTNGINTYTATSLQIVSNGGEYNAVDFYITDSIAPNSQVTVSGSRSGGLNNAIFIRAFNGMGDDFKMANANIISTVYGNDEVVYNVPSDTMFVHIILVGSRGTAWAEDSVATFSDLTITWKTGVDSAVVADLQGQINENAQKIEDIEGLSNIDEYVNVVNQKLNRFEAKVTELESLIDDDLSINDALNPTPIIFDTDFGGDSDDAIAVRVLSYYESIGTVRTIFASMNHREIRCLKGMNALFEYDGTFDLPITMPSGSIEEWSQGYGYTLSLYPHTQNTPYSVRGYKAYRKALSQLTRKCVIVAVGTYKNISDLLNSTADEYSNLTGIQLMQEKVEKLVLMGGAFPNSLDAMGDQGADVGGVQTPGAEWNFAGNIPATTNVIANCPVPIIFCGWEIGHAIKCGGGISDKLPSDDALIAALRKHGGETEVANGRDGFDPITTAIACVGDARKLGYELVRGTINYDPTTSRNTFTESPNGNHYYVKTKYEIDYYKKFMNHIVSKDWWGNTNTSRVDRLI